MNFQEGDRVKRADATENSIPGFKNMRGTIKGKHTGYFTNCGNFYDVAWDCDQNLAEHLTITPVREEWLAKVERDFWDGEFSLEDYGEF